MARHASPVEPPGREGQRWRRRHRVSPWRFLLAYYPAAFASAFLGSADVPWYYHPFLIVFGAILPLTVIGGLATGTANRLSDRRARLHKVPRPIAVYMLLASGSALAGVLGAFLAWAAGARSTSPGVGESGIATALVWVTMISACAALMMIGRVITCPTRQSVSR